MRETFPDLSGVPPPDLKRLTNLFNLSRPNAGFAGMLEIGGGPETGFGRPGFEGLELIRDTPDGSFGGAQDWSFGGGFGGGAWLDRVRFGI